MDPSPLAPVAFPELPPVEGVRLATLAAGLRYVDRVDLMLAELAPGTHAAGVFTKSGCPSAPVDWCKRALRGEAGSARALVCNSGNANAFTGRAGAAVAERTADAVARGLGVASAEVMLASTGVIGEVMAEDSLAVHVPALVADLHDSSPSGWQAAADAIRTTDTFAKGAFSPVGAGAASHVVGIAKGSGMIAPDMATMLAFIFTDQPVSHALLQPALTGSVRDSFNSITVDSDMSTSDTVLLFSTPGPTAAAAITAEADPRFSDFRAALDAVTLDLAHQIVRDGEGATKFVTIHVRGAESAESAKALGLAIGNSPLVKTALAAEDANWGRIVMAIGKSGEPADRDALSVWIGDEQCAEKGGPWPAYDESRASEHLRRSEIDITVDVGVGEGRSTVWTCDLTHGYIDINAGYRT